MLARDWDKSGSGEQLLVTTDFFGGGVGGDGTKGISWN